MDIKKVSPHYRGPRKKAQASGSLSPEKGAYGGFVRMSHEASVERGSIENHKMEIERIAEARGMTLSTWYILPAVSGKTIWNNVEVVRMRSDIEAGKIKGIIFTKLARLCRNVKELLEFRDFFQAHGAHLVCPEVSTVDPGGRLLFTLLGAIAEMERENIAERILASVKPRAARGLALGGKPKYGFRWVKEKDPSQPWRLEQNPAEVAVIRQLLDIFLRLQSYKAAARELNTHSKTRGGFAWSDSRVVEILTNPIYRGSWIRNRTTWDKTRVVEKDSADWVLIPIPRIFSAAEEREVDAIIARIQAALTRPTSIQRYLLTQIVCECGGKVYGNRRVDQDRYKCVKCKNSIPVPEMDAAILGELEGIHQNSDQIARLSGQLRANVAHREALVTTIATTRARLAQVEARMGEVTRLALELGAGVVKGESQRLTSEAEALRAQITTLEGEAAGYIQITDVAAFLDRVSQIPAVLRALPADRARYHLLASLVPRITLGREVIDYEINFIRDLPVFHETATDPHGYVAVSRNRNPPPYLGSLIRLDPSVLLPHVPLGQRLKWAREYLKLTQKDLAKLWKRNEMTINGWETRGRVPADPVDLPRIEKLIAKAKAKLNAKLKGLSK